MKNRARNSIAVTLTQAVLALTGFITPEVYAACATISGAIGSYLASSQGCASGGTINLTTTGLVNGGGSYGIQDNIGGALSIAIANQTSPRTVIENAQQAIWFNSASALNGVNVTIGTNAILGVAPTPTSTTNISDGIQVDSQTGSDLLGTITNSGIIYASNYGVIFEPGGSSTAITGGTVVNSAGASIIYGSCQTNDFCPGETDYGGIFLDGNVTLTSVSNAGTITFPTATQYGPFGGGGDAVQIDLFNEVHPTTIPTITNGFTNTGTITAGSIYNSINVQQGLVSLTNSGSMTGDVILWGESSGVPILTMNPSSSLTGNVQIGFDSSVPTGTNTIDLYGGSISGSMLLSGILNTITNNVNMGSSSCVGCSGTNVAGTITGGNQGDTYMMYGGTFGALSAGSASTDTMTVLTNATPFTPGGDISGVETITVQSGATFNAASIDSTGIIPDILNFLNIAGTMTVSGAVNAPATAALPLTFGSGSGTGSGSLELKSGGSINALAVQPGSFGGLLTIDSGATLSTTAGATTPAILSVVSATFGTAFDIKNSGTITSSDPTVIDLSATNGANVTTSRLYQNAGSITGNILLASGGGNVFDLIGGTVTGNATASNVPANSIINLSGGSLVTTPTTSGVLFLNGTAGDTVNLTKTSDVRRIQGGSPFLDMLNVNSGSATSITMAANNNVFDVHTINVATPFVINGNIGTNGVLNHYFQTFLATGGPVTQSGSVTGSGSASGDSTFQTDGNYFLCSGAGVPDPTCSGTTRGTLQDVYSIIFDGTTKTYGDISNFHTMLATGPLTQGGSITGTGFTSTDSTFEADSNYTLNAYNAGPPIDGLLTDVYSISLKGTTIIDGYISNFHSFLAADTSTVSQTGTIIGADATATFETDGNYTLGPFTAGTPNTGYLSQFNTITFKGPLTTISGTIDTFADIEANGPVVQTGTIQGVFGSSILNAFSTYNLSGGLIDSVSPIFFFGPVTTSGVISNVDSLTMDDRVTQSGGLITGHSITTSTMITNGPYTQTGGIISQFNILTMTNTFTQNGSINSINTLNVTPFGGDFGNLTSNAPMSAINILLNIGAGCMVTANSTITGGAHITNSGSLLISGTGQVNLTGAQGYKGPGAITVAAKTQPAPGTANNFNLITQEFTLQSGGAIGVGISGVTQFGSMKTSGPIVLEAGTTIQPFLSGYVPASGTVFPVIQGGHVTDDGIQVIYPTNTLLAYFTKQISHGGTEFDLVYYRRNFLYCASNPIAVAIAQILDDIVAAGGYGNPEFLALIFELDSLLSCTQLNDALVALSPNVDYGMVEGAHIGMDRTFGLLWQRLEDFHKYRNMQRESSSPYYSGFNTGDDNEAPYGIWVAPYGEWLRQDGYQYNNGYRATALGGAIGFDKTCLNDSIWGIAGSFTRAHVVGSTYERNVENVSSLQGTLYAFWEPLESLAADLMVGMALNSYQNNRYINIGAIDLNANSRFYGWQYGGQFDLGYVDCEESLYIVPMTRIKATYLRLDSFTEANAGALGLSTKERSLTQLMAGGGFRFAKQVVGYPFSSVPEISMIYLYDFSAQAQQTVANFIGGGAAFPTVGTRPPRNAFLIDLAYEVFEIENKDRVVTARYELELRQRFIANSGYIEFYYQWC